MIKISDGRTNKEVTKGAYENFYKPFGYHIVGEEKKNREVEKPKEEIKQEVIETSKEEVIESRIDEDKENNKSPETKEFKKR